MQEIIEITLSGETVNPSRIKLGYAGNYGVYRLRIMSDAAWGGLTIKTVWATPYGAVEALLADGTVDVPAEATALPTASGYRTAGIVGVKDGECLVSARLAYEVVASGPSQGHDPELTPSLADQILAISAEDRKASEQVRAMAEAANEKALTAVETANQILAGTQAAQEAARTASAKAEEAAASAGAAASSEAAAAESKSAAALSAQSAATSAAAAAKDAESIGEAADKAAKEAGAAAGSATAAAESAASAAEAATKAGQSAGTATEKASEAESARAAAESASASAADSAKRSEDAAKTAGDAATKVINEGVAEKLTEMQGIQEDVKARQQDVTEKQAEANAAKTAAQASATQAGQSATQAGQSATAAAASAKAAASAVGATFYGVEFTGSPSAGTRTGAAADFVFTPGTDTSAGQNDFDGVYPWAGMRRCCCTLNTDGTVTVNAYKGQPGYIEDGTNGEVLVEVPLFYVAGMLDVDPRVSAVPMPGFRAPRKFRNSDGSLKQRCYLPAFPGSIGSDGKLHSIAGAVSTGNTTITAFLAAAREWGETYSIGTSADFEVLAYLMIVAYGTRNVQAKMRGVSNLYATNQAVTGARTSEAAITVAKGVLEVGNVISIGTGSEDESIAKRRIVTAVEAIDGDSANVKVSFDGEAVTTTTAHKVWRIMEATGTANSVISTCGSPVSNTDGKHSFVFYGVENPLYGNQWRMECDWKPIDGVPYYCDDPTKYQWSSANDYIKLDTLTLPGEGWAKNLQADERFPWLQITKEVGGSSGTYLADYFYINKSGTRIVLRGAYSYGGDLAGAFRLALHDGASLLGWGCSADLSIPG